MKNFSLVLLSLCFLGQPLQASAKESRLDGFDFLKIGMDYTRLVEMKAACDQLRDTPDLRGSKEQGLTSTVCPTSETFAMATLLDNKVTAVAVNWVSWDMQHLKAGSPLLHELPAQLRKRFGIPTDTLPYESALGNRDADSLCGSGEFTCQMHVWKAKSPDRLATLIYAKNANREIPLLFHISDLETEGKIEAIKNRQLQARIKAVKNGEDQAH